MFIYNFIRAWNSAELRQAPDFVDQQLDEMQAFDERQRKTAAATPPPPAPPTAVTKPAPIPPRPPVTKKEKEGRKAGSASKTVPVPIPVAGPSRQTGTRPVPKKVEVVMPPRTLHQIEEELDENENDNNNTKDGNAAPTRMTGPMRRKHLPLNERRSRLGGPRSRPRSRGPMLKPIRTTMTLGSNSTNRRVGSANALGGTARRAREEAPASLVSPRSTSASTRLARRENARRRKRCRSRKRRRLARQPRGRPPNPNPE